MIASYALAGNYGHLRRLGDMLRDVRSVPKRIAKAPPKCLSATVRGTARPPVRCWGPKAAEDAWPPAYYVLDRDMPKIMLVAQRHLLPSLAQNSNGQHKISPILQLQTIREARLPRKDNRQPQV